jgi:hypothetical protein
LARLGGDRPGQPLALIGEAVGEPGQAASRVGLGFAAVFADRKFQSAAADG